MNLRIQKLTLLLMLASGILVTTPLDAQPPAFGNADSTAPANEVTHFKGKLKGMVRHGNSGIVVVVVKEDGSEAMVAPPDNLTSFQFVAKAIPAFLQRGMLVRFTSEFGPGGVPLAPVAKVSLFQPVDLRSVQGRAKQEFTPGVYSESQPNNRNQPLAGKLTVVGRLIGWSGNGILAVQAGNVPVQIPVNETTEFEVRYNDLSLAQEGDPVTVAGFFQPPNENQVKADRITITTDRVYGEYQPPAESRKARKKRGVPVGAQDDDPKSAEPTDSKPSDQAVNEKADS